MREYILSFRSLCFQTISAEICSIRVTDTFLKIVESEYPFGMVHSKPFDTTGVSVWVRVLFPCCWRYTCRLIQDFLFFLLWHVTRLGFVAWESYVLQSEPKPLFSTSDIETFEE